MVINNKNKSKGEKVIVQASSVRLRDVGEAYPTYSHGEKAIVQASSVRPSLMPEKVEISISSGKKPSYRLRVHDLCSLSPTRRKSHRTGFECTTRGVSTSTSNISYEEKTTVQASRVRRGSSGYEQRESAEKVIVPILRARRSSDFHPVFFQKGKKSHRTDFESTTLLRHIGSKKLVSRRKIHRADFESTTEYRPDFLAPSKTEGKASYRLRGYDIIDVLFEEKVIVPTSDVRPCCDSPNRLGDCCLEEGRGIVLTLRVRPCVFLILAFSESSRKMHRTDFESTTSSGRRFRRLMLLVWVLHKKIYRTGIRCATCAPGTAEVAVKKKASYRLHVCDKRNSFRKVRRENPPYWLQEYDRIGTPIVMLTGQTTKKSRRTGLTRTSSTIYSLIDGREKSTALTLYVCGVPLKIGFGLGLKEKASYWLYADEGNVARPSFPSTRKEHRTGFMCATRVDEPKSIVLASGVRSEDRTKEHRIGFAYTTDDRDHTTEIKGIVPALHVRRDGLLRVIARAMHITKKRNIVPVLFLRLRRIWYYIDYTCNHKNKEVSYQLYSCDRRALWVRVCDTLYTGKESSYRHYVYDMSTRWFPGLQLQSKKRHRTDSTGMTRANEESVRSHQREERRDIVSVLPERLRLNVTLTVSKIPQMKEKKSCLSCGHDYYEEPIKTKHTVLVLGIRRPSPPESTDKEQKGHRTSPMCATQVLGCSYVTCQPNKETHRIGFLYATNTGVNNEFLQKRDIVSVLFVRLSQVFLFCRAVRRNIAPVFCGRRSVYIDINRLFIPKKETSHLFYVCGITIGCVASVLDVRLGDFDVRSSEERDIVQILSVRRGIEHASGVRQLASRHLPTDLTHKRYRALFERSTRVKVKTTFQKKGHRACLNCTALRALFYLDHSDIVRILNARRFGDSETIRNKRDIVQILRARTFNSGSLENSKHQTNRVIAQVLMYATFWQKRHRTGLICTTVSLSSYGAIIKALSGVRRADNESQVRRGIVAALSARRSRRSEISRRDIVPALTVRPDTLGGLLVNQTSTKEASYQSYLYDKKCTVERRYFSWGYRTDLKYTTGRLDFKEQHQRTVRGTASTSRMRRGGALSETSHRSSRVRRLKMFRIKNLWRRGTVPAFGVRRQSHRATLCTLFDKDIARASHVRPGFMSRLYNKLNIKPTASNLDAREKPSHRASVVRRCFCLLHSRSIAPDSRARRYMNATLRRGLKKQHHRSSSIALDYIMRQSSEDIHRSVIVPTLPVRRSSAYPDTKDLSQRLCVCDSSFRDLQSKEGD